MSDERDYTMGELDRRQGNMVRFGTVAEIDPATARVKVDLGDLVTDWVLWGASRAGGDRTWSAPDVGEQVLLVSPGEPSQGVVVCSLFQDAHPQNGNAGKDWRVTFKDGTVLEFDRDGSVLRVIVNAAGSALVQVGSTQLQLQNGQATLKATAITLDGNVAVTGTLSAQGAASMGAGVAVQGNVTATGSITDGDGDGGA